MDRRTLLRGLAGGLISVGVSRQSWASDNAYPQRPVRIVLPFPPGGAIDEMTRIASQMLSTTLKQSFVVESMPGAGGMIGSAFVAHARPDGQTLLAASASAITIAPFMHKTMMYDPVRDLTPIVMLGDSPIAVVVRENSPFKTLQDFINAARAKPGALSYGSAGVGTAAHLGGVLFEWRAGVKLLHVPYQGVSPSIVDLLGGRVDVMFVNFTVVDPQVRAGKLRVLAIAAKARMKGRPEFPTAAELGVPDYVAGNWNGLMGPAKLSPTVVKTINQVVVDGFKNPQLLQRMTEMGMVPLIGTPSDFSARIQEEVTQMKTLIKAAGIQPT